MSLPRVCTSSVTLSNVSTRTIGDVPRLPSRIQRRLQPAEELLLVASQRKVLLERHDPQISVHPTVHLDGAVHPVVPPSNSDYVGTVVDQPRPSCS